MDRIDQTAFSNLQLLAVIRKSSQVCEVLLRDLIHDKSSNPNERGSIAAAS